MLDQALTPHSYKDQTVIEPFSPKHNVIVGRNGSGKSNFFAAIRFILSDAYTQLGREERAALLHEGAGSAVMSAYVEVIFDNSDARFPTGTEEVVLRRTVGQKKDEYSLNRKNTTKNEVMSMLESAGFSKSNPYYIVPQGRVTRITNMKDAERLDMLKDVAGTQVYESRRAESRKIMEETEHKREKIDDLLEHIRGRLSELEEEKEELRAYQEKDRERRCLEYTIHHKDQEALQEALDKLNEDREDGVERTDESRQNLQQTEIQLESLESEIGDLQQQLKMLADDKSQLEIDRKDSAKEKAKIELDVQSIVDNQSAVQQARSQRESDLRDVQSQIKQREAALAQLTPEYAAKATEEGGLKQQLHDAEATRQRLYAKQGRSDQFKSKQERDQYLQREVADVNMALVKRKAVVMEIGEEITELEVQISRMDSEVVSMRDRIDNRGDEQQNISQEVQRAKEEQHRLQDQRKELWREEAKLDSVIANARQELDNAEQFLSRMMDQNLNRGLQNVRRIVQQHGIEGAYGPLGELFDFTDKYKTAVEVTAGTSLFNYVVDNADTASRISDELKKNRLGRVTFVPLAQVKTRPANLPKASDVVHLISKLRYNPEFEPAFQQVFGKTIVCPNLQVAAQYARSHGVNAITPDGDRSDKKGALTGGWHDVRNSRIDGIKREKKAREEYQGNAGRKQEIQSELDSIGQRVTKAMSDLQKLEQRRMQTEGGYEPLRQELQRLQHNLNLRRDELEQKQKQRDMLDGLVRDMGVQLSGYQSELGSDFKKSLSNAEQRHLDDLNTQLPRLRRQYAELSTERSELEVQKNNIELELRENLRLRLDQLQSGDAEGGASSKDTNSGTRLKERQRDLKRINGALESVNAKLSETETEIEAAQQKLEDTEKDRTTRQSELETLRHKIANHQKAVQKAAAKRSTLAARLADVAIHIRNLGALPDVAFQQQYTGMAANTATARLHKVQDALKKYGHVNKKAFEQFAQFERQRDTLETRRQELDASDASIRELIDVLDQRKDEAIERTFRQVSREFASIFERLVPAGKGRLVIQRRSDRQARPEEAEAESGDEDDAGPRADKTAGGGVENYTGVGISVSFNSKHDEQQRIQQLSGGQKSLCALALVFAIQASDPAPFYLFDEIDANLDAQYRTAVAMLLRDSAGSGQFICTTFRPEMLLVADKCYGVSYVGKTSGIGVVEREEALKFVEGEVGRK